jgi:hypothetical protein
MSIQGVSHEELIAKIRALKDNREFSPCTIIAKAPTIFRPILDELRNLIAYRNYANWLLSTDYPKPPTFPLIRSHQGGIPHLEFIDTERMKMFLTKASPDTTTSPFVAEVLHDFFARHPECLSYFAMVGCPNLFLGYLSEDHLNRAERFFVTCIRKYGISDPMVKLLVVNFLCHAFDFLGALRSRFSEKAPMLDDQSPFNMSEWLIDCFVSSLPCLSAPYLAVLREAIHNSDATFAIVWQDFLPRIVDDWMSYDRLSDHLRGSPPDEPTRNALLRAVDDLKQSAQPLDIDGLVYGRPRPKYLCSLLDAHVIDSHRSATGSPTILRQLIGPLDVQTLGLDFFEFEVGLAKEALPYAVSDSLSRLKGRGDLLDILAAERPDLLPEYLAELEATALCIDRMRKRFHTPRILASIRAEAEMSALAAFRRYARVSPLGRAQMETAYSDFVHAKIADLLR